MVCISSHMPSLDSPLVLLRMPQVRGRTGLSRSTIYAMIARGEFPQPVRLGANSVAWPEADISSWIAARVAERDAVQVIA